MFTAYIYGFYYYCINIFRNMFNYNDKKMIKHINYNDNDIFTELDSTQKAIIKTFKLKLERLNDNLKYSEDEIYNRLIKINNSFTKKSNIRDIIISLERKKENILSKNEFDKKELNVELVKFNSEILFLLEKFKIIQEIHNTEYNLQTYLDKIIIK